MSQPDPKAMRRASRHLPIAGRLTGENNDALLRKFRDQRVLLTGDSRRLRTAMGRLMLRTAANLIARFSEGVDIDLGTGLEELEAEVRGLLVAIDSRITPRKPAPGEWNGYAAVLSVGTQPKTIKTLVAVDASRWLAMVSRTGNFPLAGDDSGENPFGALTAAALGAAEVFKLLVCPRPEKAGSFGETTFSAYDYSVGGVSQGPPVLGALALPPSLLAGVGAVGNAFLLALAEVPGLHGELAVLDEQVLDDPSNLNRYVLAVESDAELNSPAPKTALATRHFQGRSIRIRELPHPVGTIPEIIATGRIPRPRVVLCGLDNNPSRHELQDLWPDLLLEGATGDTLAQVSRHEHGSGLACLRCLHPLQERPEVAYEDRINDVSGLPRAWVQLASQSPQMILTQEIINQVDPERRPALLEHVGKPACSVLDGIEKLSVKRAEELPFQPTVSFVSALAGFLMAAEYVKHLVGAPPIVGTFFQADLMFPLQNAFTQVMEQSARCYCVERKDVIARYRAEVAA